MISAHAHIITKNNNNRVDLYYILESSKYSALGSRRRRKKNKGLEVIITEIQIPFGEIDLILKLESKERGLIEKFAEKYLRKLEEVEKVEITTEPKL